MSSAEEAPVYITSYDPAWPALFELEQQLLDGLHRPWLAGPIEHVGSTAVLGRPAKPTDAVVAHEYAELKYRLAEVHGFDREAYTEGEDPFIARVLKNLERGEDAR